MEFSQASTLQRDRRRSNPLTSHCIPKSWVCFFSTLLHFYSKEVPKLLFAALLKCLTHQESCPWWLGEQGKAAGAPAAPVSSHCSRDTAVRAVLQGDAQVSCSSQVLQKNPSLVTAFCKIKTSPSWTASRQSLLHLLCLTGESQTSEQPHNTQNSVKCGFQREFFISLSLCYSCHMAWLLCTQIENSYFILFQILSQLSQILLLKEN